MFTPCHCPEAQLLRQVLTAEIPAADTPTWRALLGLVDAAAARRAVLLVCEASVAVSTATDWASITANPSHSQLVCRRYPPDGNVARWVAHGTQCCPEPPCAGINCHHPTVHTTTADTARRDAA